MRRLIFIFLFLPFILMGQDADVSGKELYKTNCKACHAIDQKLVGPALKGVTERREIDWLYSFIKHSGQMIKEGDPIANELFLEFNQVPMPDQNLSNEEIDRILAYIKTESAPKDASANPIQRPYEEPLTAEMKQLQFTSYTFWIIFTLFVIALFATFYYLTITTDTYNEDEQ